MNLNLKGKTALVMGSSQGLGRACAESLINEGVRVALCSRSKDSLSNTAQEIGAETFFPCDLTKPYAGKDATEQALKHFGNLDILVTNTGGPAKGDFKDISREQWLIDFESIWMSVVEATQTALPIMQKNKYGRILMITSIAAQIPLPGLTTSNGLRAGLYGLARSMAKEYAKDGITANLLLPGYTSTDRLKALNLSDEKVKSMVPAGRLGSPHELADLCAFLASEKGSYITGQSIAIDGAASI